MGTQEAEWIDVANSLLTKCRINLQIRELSDCDAGVFVTLYEAILGEKVPDFIPDTKSPEDDAHNVQSVIDSLALDYLQVSLSHITGENIVRGDAESIRNLLEIFDGLLEYLTEQISECSSLAGEDLEGDFVQRRSKEIPKGEQDLLPALRHLPSESSTAPSSEIFAPSWEVDGSESTAELIRLGDTAHTFTMRGSAVEPAKKSDKLKPERKSPDDKREHDRPSFSPYPIPSQGGNKQPHAGKNFTLRRYDEDLPSAIPLSRPFQPKEGSPFPTNREVQPLNQEVERPSAIVNRSEPADGDSLPQRSQREGNMAAPAESPISPFPKKVAFRTLPDVRIMTLRSSMGDTENGASASEDNEEDLGSSTFKLTGAEDRGTPCGCPLVDSQASDTLLTSITDEPFSVQRARNRLSEQELQEMSEKLSRRLDELDRMLKKAIGEQDSLTETKEEDKLSQHSDSIMQFHRKKQLQAMQSARKPQNRPRSLSSSPTLFSLPHRTPCVQFEDTLHREAQGETGKVRRGLQKELDLQRVKSQFLTNTYEDELRDYEDRERIQLSELKAKLKKVEQECKENIPKAPVKKSQPEKVYSGKQNIRSSKCNKWIPNIAKTRAQMKIKDNDLLPMLLDEFPYLQISPHTLKGMWKGQVAQMEILSKASEEDERSERKLQNEVEEVRKKHDLLVNIIHKEQGQNQRLRDFKERIRLQKSAQNKMKENRQQAARAKRYYEDYHVQLRARLMRARTREERLFKKLFEEGLELQKERLREIRSYTKEQREEQRKRHKDELDSMENHYKDQFSMLADTVRQERQDIHTREKAQAKTLHKIKRELRAKMEREIQELQDMIIRTDEDAFFRELEAERLKRRLQMASFQYSKSHCM
ncbi:hypothetical protein GDO86_013800 [Hymenochirus boettgeri]|uniref:DUF5745 domain-containing protein n=1 Tax=Hymenochirus boettgeri TaxID=247094 RepID=A0A8T2JRH4_9PIPI|nr:hypothetical protein GDO86_013800 [Hymenochirus boettgeri]